MQGGEIVGRLLSEAVSSIKFQKQQTPLARIAPGNLDLFYRYALSHPVTTAIIGCDTVGQREENVRFASSLTPMSEDEKKMLSGRLSRIAGS